MNRKEANKIIEKHSAALGALPREAIEAIEFLINAEHCRETDDYENEIADLQNRLDIAEYDNERWKEKVTVLDEKLKALSAEPCEDAISRQEAIDTIERWLSCGAYNEAERHIMRAVRSVLYDLPPVTPIQKMGEWIVDGSVDCYLDKVRCHCSNCGKKKEFPADYDHKKQELRISYKHPEFIDNYCPCCGVKMEVGENGDK